MVTAWGWRCAWRFQGFVFYDNWNNVHGKLMQGRVEKDPYCSGSVLGVGLHTRGETNLSSSFPPTRLLYNTTYKCNTSFHACMYVCTWAFGYMYVCMYVSMYRLKYAYMYHACR